MKTILIEEAKPSEDTQSFPEIKNQKKLELLKEKLELSKYPTRMLKLLLDGDYRQQLGEYKDKVMMLCHELVDKGVKHTKFGVNTLLYKILKDIKAGKTGLPHEEEVEEVSAEEFEEELLKIARQDKQSAIYVLKQNLSPSNPLYREYLTGILSA